MKSCLRRPQPVCDDASDARARHRGPDAQRAAKRSCTSAKLAHASRTGRAPADARRAASCRRCTRSRFWSRAPAGLTSRASQLSCWAAAPPSSGRRRARASRDGDRAREEARTRCGLTSSAAAVGVGARTSAAKSAMVKSVSCPTPPTTGSALPAIARASTSSLKAHRSSIDPPPRHSDQHIRFAPRVRGLDHRGELRRPRALHRRG